jgi:hypothetical protein
MQCSKISFTTIVVLYHFLWTWVGVLWSKGCILGDLSIVRWRWRHRHRDIKKRNVEGCVCYILAGPRHIPMELWYRDHRILGVWDRKVWYLSPNLGPPEPTCMVPWLTESCPSWSRSDPMSTENRRFDSLGEFLWTWHEFRPLDPRKILQINFRFGPLLCLKQAIRILVNNFGELNKIWSRPKKARTT